MLDKTNRETAVISAPRMRKAVFTLNGTAPYMQNRFSQKGIDMMRAKHEAGGQGKTKRNREARNFNQDYKNAIHLAKQGWPGVPAGAFRTAMIDCCRLVGYKMTFAKLAIFCEPDGFDKVDGTPLVRIKGKHEMHIGTVRNQTGVADLRARPMWREWSIDLTVRWDEDQFSLTDVTNLLARVGMQCGIGEGRPNSRECTGIGFGLFEIGSKRAR